MAIPTLNRIIPDNGSNNDYDTGLSSSTKLNENCSKLEQFMSDISASFTELQKKLGGIQKGMSVRWDLNLGAIPTGFVLNNGNGGVKINGVTIPDDRARFTVGYDPAKAVMPANSTDLTENYGKIGNTGGEATHKLKVAEMPVHKHKILGNLGNDQSNTPGREMGTNGDDYGNITENAGGDQAHENRPLYIVVCWITKVSEDTTATYNSAYDSYKATTTDVPMLTEAEWSAPRGGADGITPTIGLNGNWFTGDVDSGVKAQGTAGKSAYELALDGGFGGSEAQWLVSLKGAPGYTPQKGIDYSDGAPGVNAPVTMAIYQIGANGMALPRKLPAYAYDRIISAVRLSSDCSGLSAKIGATDYNHITLVGVTIPANVELIINYLTVSAGNDSADALIIF